MKWRGWINDGITKPPDGRETLAVASAPLPSPGGNGDWGGFRQLPAPFGEPAGRRGFSHLSFQSGVFWLLPVALPSLHRFSYGLRSAPADSLFHFSQVFAVFTVRVRTIW